jgi:CTP synthase
VIFKLRDLVNVEEFGGTMRLGACPCELADDSLVREIYGGSEMISERHRHRYEFNPEFRETLHREGLRFSGISPDGKFVEIVELSRDVHPWFLGCQFHPEYKSKPLNAHPLFASFIRAAFDNRMRNETSMETTDDSQVVEPERLGVAGDD